MDLHELEHKTVKDLRDMAKEYDDIEGTSGMKKDDLLEVLCTKLGIDRHAKVPEGIGRRKLRQEIRELRQKRDAALEARDSSTLAAVRGAIKSKKRRIRRQIATALRQESGKPKAEVKS